MAFINQVISAEDIEKYGLPFKQKSDFYWTRDIENNFYLWGGLGGNPAYGEEIEGRFHLYLDGEEFYFVIRPGKGSFKFSESPYVVVWKSIEYVKPLGLDAMKRVRAINILRDALTVYGRNGRDNKYTPSILVKFEF